MDADYLKKIKEMFPEKGDRHLRQNFISAFASLNEHIEAKGQNGIGNQYAQVEVNVPIFVNNALECMNDEDDMNVPNDVIDFYNKYFAKEDEEFESDEDDDELEKNLFDDYYEDKAYEVVETIAENFNNFVTVDKIADKVKLHLMDTRKIVSLLQSFKVCGVRSGRVEKKWKRSPSTELDSTIILNIIRREAIKIVFNEASTEDLCIIIQHWISINTGTADIQSQTGMSKTEMNYRIKCLQRSGFIGEIDEKAQSVPRQYFEKILKITNNILTNEHIAPIKSVDEIDEDVQLFKAKIIEIGEINFPQQVQDFYWYYVKNEEPEAEKSLADFLKNKQKEEQTVKSDKKDIIKISIKANEILADNGMMPINICSKSDACILQEFKLGIMRLNSQDLMHLVPDELINYYNKNCPDKEAKQVEPEIEQESLTSLLSDIQNTVEEKKEISVHHKEMLIEILHKLI